MSSFLSISALRESMINMTRRFSAACGFAIALSLALIIMVWAEEYRGVIIYYLTAGYLLSLMLELWNEEFHRPRIFWTVAVASHVLLLVDAIFLWNSVDSYFDMELYIARSAVYVALILGILFLPFYGESNDIKSWNFTRRLIIAMVLSFLIGWVMTLGSEALLYGIGALFDIEIDSKVAISLAILFNVLLTLLLFLSRIPQGERKHDTSVITSRFLTGTTRYLFIPLVACYIVVLYGYLARIILTWELPNGTVSWLVTIMMFGLIIIEFLLYPTMRNEDTRSFERWVVRWFPLLALPLVILMTVGIVRRFSDYGITTNRLYILTLNLWYYVVSIGLFVIQARRIHWIPLSFGALLLLTSAQPMNYCEIVKRHFRQRIQALMTQYTPQQLPMDQEAYDAWIGSLPMEVRNQTRSTMRYLTTHYNNQTDKWLTKDVYLFREVEFQETVIIECKSSSDFITLPQGYGRMSHENANTAEVALRDSILTLSVTNDDKVEYLFDVNLELLRRADEQQQDIGTLFFPEQQRGDSVILSFNRIRIYSWDAEENKLNSNVNIFYK